jgi:hypothetical protein
MKGLFNSIGRDVRHSQTTNLQGSLSESFRVAGQTSLWIKWVCRNPTSSVSKDASVISKDASVMAAVRKLIRVTEKGYEGVACDSCGWVHPYPRMIAIEALRDLRAAFHGHRCEENQRPTRRSQP